jgi:hypothetical protein
MTKTIQVLMLSDIIRRKRINPPAIIHAKFVAFPFKIETIF